MRFGILQIENFLSFGPTRCQIDLDGAGLVGIFGNNIDNLGGTSNGSGKSATLESLCWCLYGETTRGIRGDDVVNLQTGQDCVVSVSVHDTWVSYQIVRKRATSDSKRSHDLQLIKIGDCIRDDKDISAGIMSDTQVLVDNLLGMNFETFCQSVLLTDKTQSFCMMTDSQQKQLLEDILQIGVLSKAQKECRSRMDSLKEQVQTNAMTLKFTKQELENHVIHLNNVKRNLTQFETNKASKLKTLEAAKAQKTELLAQSADGQKQYDLAKAKYDKAEATVALTEQTLNTLQKEIYAVKVKTEQHRNQIKLKLNEIETTRRHVKKDCDAVSSLAGTVCTNCRQQVDTATAEHQLTTWNSILEDMATKSARLQELMTALDEAEQQDLETSNANHENETEKLRKNKALQNKQLQDMRTLQTKINNATQLSNDILSLQNNIDEQQKETNPFTDMEQQTVDKIAKLEVDVETADQAGKDDERKLEYLKFWDKGFGPAGLKSLMMDSALPFLDERANHYANLMSAGSIKISFNTLTENKGGNVKDKFSVSVVNQNGAEAYKGNSSGERRRADVAVSLALADLAGTRATKPVQFLALDEYLGGLDESGVDEVVKLLHVVAEDRGTCLVITHDASLQDKFTKVINVEKRGGFSRIVGDS